MIVENWGLEVSHTPERIPEEVLVGMSTRQPQHRAALWSDQLCWGEKQLYKLEKRSLATNTCIGILVECIVYSMQCIVASKNFSVRLPTLMQVSAPRELPPLRSPTRFVAG